MTIRAPTDAAATATTAGSPTGLLRCPAHHLPLTEAGGALLCPQCGAVGERKDGIASFLAKDDSFYEAKYNNRTRYMPRNDGFLATLPLRVVLQGYPNAIARELPAGSTIVEIGCAAGIDWFGKRYRMIGLDLSLTALRIASQTYAEVVQCDATRMPLDDASVDGVISSCLFEHLSPEGKDALLAECRRVLKPGGKLVFFYDIKTDNPVIASYRRRRPDLYQSSFLDSDGHIGYDTIDRNRQHYRDAGLRITGEVFHERTPLLPNSVWQKLSLWPGLHGVMARVGRTLTSGYARLPSLAAIALTDATLGRLLPPRFARGLTTIAHKPDDRLGASAQ